MSNAIVWNQWRTGKMSDADCLRDLVRCKDARAPGALLAFETIRKKDRMQNLQDEILRVQESLRLRQKPFLSHPLIDGWLKQYEPQNYGVLARFQVLALVGGSQQGKTSKAVSVFGISRSLKVSCQSCPIGILPSLAAFNRCQHKAIVFDECRVDQILSNREFFQASSYPQQMSQSLCNQHMYEVWVYQTALIVCCNALQMGVEDGLSESDADWMLANVVPVRLSQGQTWYAR